MLVVIPVVFYLQLRLILSPIITTLDHPIFSIRTGLIHRLRRRKIQSTRVNKNRYFLSALIHSPQQIHHIGLIRDWVFSSVSRGPSH